MTGGVDRPSAKTVLVAGASGFVGTAAVERFAAEGARVIGVSRRRPARIVEGVDYLTADLRDALSCRRLAPALVPVTHLAYAAVNETPGDLVASWTDPEHAARNGAMFANLLAAVEAAAPGLRHVSLVHGTKAYAAHRPDVHAPVPLRETLPRPDNDDFYFRQEDRLWAQAAANGWGWTVFRAPMIAGGGRGSNLNALLAIAVFAALRRDAGLDLPFPGAVPNTGVMEMVDVELLARAIAWAADAPGARNAIFNIANGDVYVWPDLWPVVAAEMGLPAGAPQPMSIRASIAAEAPRWAAIVHRHGLSVDEDPGAFLGESGALADFALNNCARSILTSTIRIRQAGFHDCVDTAESVVGWIRRWRAEGLLPPR
jgi:nucleoside-diphosphate-sugar epimerase